MSAWEARCRALERFAPLWTGVAVLTGVLLFLPPVPYWLDAPEFVAAAWNLGHAHPPGHPAMLMVLKAFLLLPVGEAGFRANLFAAVFGGVSAGIVCRLATVLALELLPGPHRGVSRVIPPVAGIVAGLGFGWSPSSVMQSLSVEVYSLNAALTLAALAVALGDDPAGRLGASRRDWRTVGPLALFVGLGLGNHHLLTTLAFPAIALALCGRGRLRLEAVGAGVLVALAVTILIYGYLWARGLAGAWPAWADTSSLDGVFWVASARMFSASLGGFDDPILGVWKNAVKALMVLAGDFSPVGPVLALGGLYLCLRAGSIRSAVVLFLLVAGSLASKVSMGILDPNNPDDHGYFLGAVAGVAVLQALFGAGLVASTQTGPRVVRLVVLACGTCVFVATALVPPVHSGPIASERLRLRDPVVLLRSIWDEQPARTVLLLSHYPVYFQALYARTVEGERPDVTLVQSSLYRKARGGQFYAERLRKEDPDLSGVVHGFLRAGAVGSEDLRALAAHRPVRMDAEDEPPIAGLAFAGWTLALAHEDEASLVERVTAHIGRLRGLFQWEASKCEDMDIETRRVLLRHLASMARSLAGLGHPEAAVRLVHAALELNPLDRQLRALAADLTGQAGGRVLPGHELGTPGGPTLH